MDDNFLNVVRGVRHDDDGGRALPAVTAAGRLVAVGAEGSANKSEAAAPAPEAASTPASHGRGHASHGRNTNRQGQWHPQLEQGGHIVVLLVGWAAVIHRRVAHCCPGSGKRRIDPRSPSPLPTVRPAAGRRRKDGRPSQDQLGVRRRSAGTARSIGSYDTLVRAEMGSRNRCQRDSHWGLRRAWRGHLFPSPWRGSGGHSLRVGLVRLHILCRRVARIPSMRRRWATPGVLFCGRAARLRAVWGE